MKYLISIFFACFLIQQNNAQEIYLKTDPDDAYVMKNDSLVGYTPLFLSPILGNILLVKPGYMRKNINLHDYDGIPIQLKFTGKKDNGTFFERPVFKIFITSAVALGAATAYFKIKADKRFDDYQTNGSPVLLNESKRYDLISGISFAALQINFGFLIYYFLSF